jgi:K+-sensing histidine kinase KdpD
MLQQNSYYSSMSIQLIAGIPVQKSTMLLQHVHSLSDLIANIDQCSDSGKLAGLQD